MSKGAFFDAHQRTTVEAAMARMIPTDHESGAREAGTIDFVERYLSGIEFIYAKPDGSGFETLTGKRAEAWRRRVDVLRKSYVEGIAALDGLAK
jgi:gluconate 2-dehydrogenase gamma chain